MSFAAEKRLIELGSSYAVTVNRKWMGKKKKGNIIGCVFFNLEDIDDRREYDKLRRGIRWNDL